MARFLMTTWPLSGHINPCLALAIALREAGHEVAIYSGERAKHAILSEQFLYFPFEQVDEEQVERALYAPQEAAGRRPRRLIEVLDEWLVKTLSGQIHDQRKLMEAWRPDVVISEITMWGPGLVLREAYGAKVAICSLAPGCMIPGPDAPPWGLGLGPPHNWLQRVSNGVVSNVSDIMLRGFRRHVNNVRQEHGLAPIDEAVHTHLGRAPLYLVPSVPELDYRRTDLPSSVHYVGPLVWSRPTREAAPAWIDELAGRGPVVHVAEGTVHTRDPFLLRAAAMGLGGKRLEVIMSCGPQRDPAQLGLPPLAENVRLERWIPHSDLLPVTDVVITTGGAGTTLAALGSGVPLVVVPTDWDKPDIARRVVDAGVGVSIAASRCTPDRLSAAVDRVLSDRGFGERARRMASLLQAAGGPAEATRLLAKLAAGGQRTEAPGREGLRSDPS